MRGRKRGNSAAQVLIVDYIKKESPNEGTETGKFKLCKNLPTTHKKRIPEWGDGNIKLIIAVTRLILLIKKESPNEGTETPPLIFRFNRDRLIIKKESPNEGTETSQKDLANALGISIKKESPNEGTETFYNYAVEITATGYIKKESPNEGTETIPWVSC